MRAALPAVDAAVVVCEMDEKKIPQLQLILRELEEQKIPRFLFLNKIDKADSTIHDALALLQPASRVKLLLRQIPIVPAKSSRLRRSRARARLCLQGARRLRGRAARRRHGRREKTARFSMLETLADHDDELMEQLLGDIEPPKDKVFDDLGEGTARRPRLPDPDGLGDAAPTACCAAEGPAPRGARHRNYRQAARRQGRQHPSPMCSRRCTPLTAARCRSRACSTARSPDSTTFLTPEREAGRVAGIFKMLGQTTEKRGPAARRRDRRARQARPCQYRRHALRRQAGASAGGQDRADAAGAGDCGHRQGAQGRRQARPGAGTSCWKKILR